MKFLKSIFFLFLIAIAGISLCYFLLFTDNIKSTSDNKKHEILIPTGANFDDVEQLLSKQNVLIHPRTFSFLAKKLNYNKLVKPGRYLIPDNFNNWNLIHKLRSGNQDAIRLTLNNITLVTDLIQKASYKLEFDSTSLANTLLSDSFLTAHKLNQNNIITFFISNTYEIWWNTSIPKFLSKMELEHQKFWNNERLAKAQKINLTTSEVTTLASIVQKESNKKDEYNRIAGVYLNRIRDNWPLQADPTVKFAMKNFELKRILTIHTKFDSPFNTYKNIGLPPGPICLPEIYAIDGVLNAEQHNYFYFCAKEDFSGHHNFASTLAEHNANATKYQAALNQRNIK